MQEQASTPSAVTTPSWTSTRCKASPVRRPRHSHGSPTHGCPAVALPISLAWRNSCPTRLHVPHRRQQQPATRRRASWDGRTAISHTANTRRRARGSPRPLLLPTAATGATRRAEVPGLSVSSPVPAGRASLPARRHLTSLQLAPRPLAALASHCAAERPPTGGRAAWRQRAKDPRRAAAADHLRRWAPLALSEDTPLPMIFIRDAARRADHAAKASATRQRRAARAPLPPPPPPARRPPARPPAGRRGALPRLSCPGGAFPWEPTCCVAGALHPLRSDAHILLRRGRHPHIPPQRNRRLSR